MERKISKWAEQVIHKSQTKYSTSHNIKGVMEKIKFTGERT